jgi:hypothetical protein
MSCWIGFSACSTEWSADAGSAGSARVAGRLAAEDGWTLADGTGVPITALPAPASIHDHMLLPSTFDVLTAMLERVGTGPDATMVHLDAGYDHGPCREERTHAGLAAARARCRWSGRPRKLAPKKVELLRMLAADKRNGVAEICQTLGISRSTLYRYAK